MKSSSLLGTSLLLCPCADMVVTKSYTSATASRSQVDAKDFDGKDSVRFQINGGSAATSPIAIYIRPFCIDNATFRGNEAASAGEMPIRKELTPINLPAT